MVTGTSTQGKPKQDPNDQAVKLKKQWKERIIVIMNSAFTTISHEMYNFLLEKAQKMDDPELVKYGSGTSRRIHQSIHVDKKV